VAREAYILWVTMALRGWFQHPATRQLTRTHQGGALVMGRPLPPSPIMDRFVDLMEEHLDQFTVEKQQRVLSHGPQ
jgi:hypothetical protein